MGRAAGDQPDRLRPPVSSGRLILRTAQDCFLGSESKCIIVGTWIFHLGFTRSNGPSDTQYRFRGPRRSRSPPFHGVLETLTKIQEETALQDRRRAPRCKLRPPMRDRGTGIAPKRLDDLERKGTASFIARPEYPAPARSEIPYAFSLRSAGTRASPDARPLC